MNWKHTAASLMVAVGLAGAVSTAAEAQIERVPYTNAVYNDAQAANAPILIGVWADWCGICQTQIGIIEALADDPRFADIVWIEVDFDTQKHIMMSVIDEGFRSTLIAMRGTRDLGRLRSITDPAQIEAFLVALVQSEP